MTTEFCYSTKMVLTVYDIDDECWNWGSPLSNLDDALFIAKCIFEGATCLNAELIEQVFITSEETGEIIAICHPDGWTAEDVDDGDNRLWEDDYDSGSYEPVDPNLKASNSAIKDCVKNIKEQFGILKF